MSGNIVPRSDVGTESIGTSTKRWAEGHFKKLNVVNGSNSPVNTLQRSTAYALGDVVTCDGLNAKFYLKCTTAGTTAVAGSAPSFSGVTGGDTVTDGTAVWTV